MRTLTLAAIAALSLSGVAMAQTPAASHMTPAARPTPAAAMTASPKTAPMMASTTKTKTTAATTTTTNDKSAMSKACSDQANTKNLHGKERKKFRNACKHGKA